MHSSLVLHLNSERTKDGTTFATLWLLPSDFDRNYKLHGTAYFDAKKINILSNYSP